MFVAVLLISISTNIYAQLTRQQAVDKVLNEIVVADTGHINVWSAPAIKNYQDTIGLIYDTVLECPYDYNWVFFVDDHPAANWAHPCRYIFIDSVSGAYQLVNENQYPVCFGISGSNDYEVVKQIIYPSPVKLPENQNPRSPTTAINDHLYAVIIVTQDTERWPGNQPNRFWYDASVVYNTLIQVYGYKDENIFIHYFNGTSPRSGNDLNEPDGDNHIDYDASKTRILETFENLAGVSTSDPDIPALGPSDQLFVYIDGHGVNDNDKSVLVCKYQGQPYVYLYDDELAQSIEDINCAQMIFLIQPCFSGNFAAELTNYNTYDVACENRVVHTSTTIDLFSTSEFYLTGEIYTEFTFYWAAAARGVYPVFDEPWKESDYATGSFPFDELYPDDEYGLPEHPDDYNPDLNVDGFVQMEEAFSYADDMDIWSPYGYYYDSPNWMAYEEPENKDIIGYENNTKYNNLITLYGLAGSVLDDDLLFSNRNYMAGNTITVEYNNSFTIEEYSNFYMTTTDAKIDVNNGAELDIEEHVSFYNNEININGDIDADTYVSFNDMYVNLNNSNMQTSFNHTTFNNSLLHNYGQNLEITNSLFNDCQLANSHRGNVNISYTNFHRTWLYLEN